MVNTQLLDYVKQQLAQGLNKETIQHNLASSGGWALSDINEAFSVLGVNQGVPISTAGAIPTAPIKYAGFWIRWVAVTVDGLILAVPIFILQIALVALMSSPGSEASSAGTAGAIARLLGILVGWIYFSLMTYYKGATLGKMMVGITVKSDDFQKLSFGRVLLRETIGKFVSTIILGIGYIIAGVTQRKQALHDKFAHSVVVYKDPSKSHTAGLVIGIILAAILPIIAILGILSSVVLVSLNTARQKGQDAQVKSVLSQMRTEAEVNYGQNNTYSKSRSCSSGMFASDPSFNTIASSLTVTSKNLLTCFAEGTTYAISAPLSTAGQNYCVDSTGFNGNGTAIDDGSKASCQTDSSSVSNNTNQLPVTQSQQSSSIPGSQPYSYTLPSGWTSVQNSGQGVQAANKTLGYVLSVTSAPIPASFGNATSINQIMNSDSVKKIIQSEFPNATIGAVGSGYVGGESALITGFTTRVTETVDGAQKQSKPLSITQYSVVHKGVLYTITLMTAVSQNSSAPQDFQTIINSFTFNQ